MLKRIKYKSNILKVRSNEKVRYTYVDKIGRFSDRINLSINQVGRFSEIDLTPLKTQQIKPIKLKLSARLKKPASLLIRNLNNLYDIKVYTEDKQVYLETVAKLDESLKSIQDQGFSIGSDYKVDAKLCLMLEKGSQFYTDYVDLSPTNGVFEIDDFLKIIRKHKSLNSVWKVFITLKDDYDNTIEKTVDLSTVYSEFKNHFLKNNIHYNQRTNDLYIDVPANDEEFKIGDISFENGNLNLLIQTNIKSPNYKSVFIARRNRQGNIFEYQDVKKYEIKNQKCNIPLESLSSAQFYDDDNLDVLIGDRFESAHYLTSAAKAKLPKNYLRISNDFIGKLYKNGRGSISIYVKQNVTNPDESGAKIAVLGTCFSRNAFNSSDYFNPDYKKYFNCVYTQFHSSIKSLISPVAPNKLIEQYKDNREFKHINTDMNKTFFKELRGSKAEYLIIDLYPDAMLQELELNNGSTITYSYLIKENTVLGDFVSNWGHEKFAKIDRFVNEWESNLEIFMKELVKIIPEEHIILNRGRLAERFYTQSDKLGRFGTIDFIRRNNYIWEKLDNLFLEKYPKIKVLNMSNTHYNADRNYPFGFSFSHYESGYYKEFLNRLVKIIYLDEN